MRAKLQLKPAIVKQRMVWAVTLFIVALLMVMTSCGPTATPTPTPSPTPTTPPTSARTQSQGASGTLSNINGNSLTLTTAQGTTVTVTVGSNTTIQETLTGTISDLQEGQSLTVIGPQDTNGNITATSIIIQPQGQSAQQTQQQASPTPPSSSSPTPATNSSSSSTVSSNIGVYSDPFCTLPVAKFDWGSLQQGNSGTQNIYLEDLGSQDVTVTVAGNGLSTGLTLTGGSLTLSPGLTSLGFPKVFQLVLTLTAAGDATTGDFNFVTSLSDLEIPSHVMVVAGPQSVSTP